MDMWLDVLDKPTAFGSGSGLDLMEMPFDGYPLDRINHCQAEALAASDPAAAAERAAYAFAEKYAIEVISDHEVRVNLGSASRIEFLREAQDLAMALHGQNAVRPERLAMWAGDPAFQAVPKNEIAVDGNVTGSTNKRRSQQEERGRYGVPLEDLAVAHAANFIATGHDLFRDNIAGARGGALNFSWRGLDIFDFVGPGYDLVATPAALLC